MLNEKQIESLFTFCKKHFVYYYDVQVELVDHLANAVEAEMLADPKNTFDKALEKVHKSFGIMGFAPLVTEKVKLAEKQGRNLFWKLFKEHLRWPKILLLFLIFSIAFTLFTIEPNLFGIFYISVMIACCLLEMYGNIKTRKEISSNGKRFLIAEFSHNSTAFSILFYFFVFPNIFDKDFGYRSYSTVHILLLSIIIGVSVITAIVNIQILSTLKNKLKQDYPEVFAAAE
jgi:hypothetical protein